MSTLRENTLLRIRSGQSIAYAIDDAVVADLPADLDALSVLAHRIRTCNSEANTWIASDLHNEFGEAFDGSGRFWCCGSKLCPECLAKTSRRNRKTLSALIKQQKLNVGEHWHFVTLTMPNYGLDLLTARSIMNYAWTLFRKRDWWRRRSLGGCKSEEFTLTGKGYHYHMHHICRTKYLEYDSLRHHWTECLRIAFERNNLSLTCATSDGLAIANVKRIGSLDEAVKEVAKYVTKASSWKKLRNSDLLDVARIQRWPRMFEFYGTFRAAPNGVADSEGDDSLGKTILDTKGLSDGEEETGWRTEVTRYGVAEYLEKFHFTVNEQSRVRIDQLKFHYKAAKFWRMPQKVPPDHAAFLARLAALHKRRGDRPRVILQTRPDKNGFKQIVLAA